MRLLAELVGVARPFEKGEIALAPERNVHHKALSPHMMSILGEKKPSVTRRAPLWPTRARSVL
jgi:hypothetical protein